MNKSERRTQVLIVGGSLGAIAAALSLGRIGVHSLLVSEDYWLGGQVTAQGVPPDEHPWIEMTGATASYRSFRRRVRDTYARVLPEHVEDRYNPKFNPGDGHVSSLCALPTVSRQVIEEMLLPLTARGTLSIFRGQRPVACTVDADRVRAVEFDELFVQAEWVLDGTETGELLALAAVEYVVGSESQEMTGEPHAGQEYRPDNQQAVSWCTALQWLPGNEEHVSRPSSYDHWKTHIPANWPNPQLSFRDADPISRQTRELSLLGGASPNALPPEGRWGFRRISRSTTAHPDRPDVTLVNWPQLDYTELPAVGGDNPAYALRRARELTLSFVHWLQLEAPREDGGYGYQELRLRGDLFETTHGLARDAYYRESRRIRAAFTVTENHVGTYARGERVGAERFFDSVGLASYRIDLHPSSGGDPYIDIESWPAQIPLGALLPERVENVLPASKNIGTTHISNGMYRVHPAEWNVGEAAGALAAKAVEWKTSPRAIREDGALLEAFQRFIHEKLGFELEWPQPIRETSRWVPQGHWDNRSRRSGWRL